MHKNLTPDLYTWKKYSSKLRLNEHHLIELNVPLHDVTLQGTKNYISNLNQISNRIQIRVDDKKMKRDSYQYCLDSNATCGKLMR